MAWGELKKAVNGTIGDLNFKPLNEIVQTAITNAQTNVQNYITTYVTNRIGTVNPNTGSRATLFNYLYSLETQMNALNTAIANKQIVKSVQSGVASVPTSPQAGGTTTLTVTIASVNMAKSIVLVEGGFTPVRSNTIASSPGTQNYNAWQKNYGRLTSATQLLLQNDKIVSANVADLSPTTITMSWQVIEFY